MSDTFTCPECHKSWDYYAVTKRLDPRPGVTRVICGDCHSKISVELKAKSLPDTAPYQKGSDSSQAGARAAHYKVGKQARQILSALADAPDGLTCKQLEFITDIPVNECSRACNQLHAKSPYAMKARDAQGAEIRRPNPGTGVLAQVYIITEAGRAVLGQTERRAA